MVFAGGADHVTYVYLLRSLPRPRKTYVGMTDDICGRLTKHNEGGVPSTVRFKPWEMVAYVAVTDRDRAAALERYFKSGSGHAFARKHLW